MKVHKPKRSVVVFLAVIYLTFLLFLVFEDKESRISDKLVCFISQQKLMIVCLGNHWD